MENMNKILVDQASYDRLANEIQKLEEVIKKCNLNRSLVHKGGTETSWDDAEFNLIEEEVKILENEILRSKNLLNNCVIVKKSSNEDIVNLGDIVKLNIVDEYGDDIIYGKLVGIAKCDQEHYYEEISVNGLIGSLIFGRTIGEKISYEFNGVSCSVEIIAKLNHVKKDKKNKTLKKEKK